MKKRKNKMVNLFKTGVLLLGISLSLWNCENDYEIRKPYNDPLDIKTNYTIEKIDYSELIADQEIKTSLPTIKQRFLKEKKQKRQGKNTVQVSEHFTIITDSIHKVTTKNVITWAFKIETPILKKSDFENFLVRKQNQKFRYFLVSYEKDSSRKYRKATLHPIPDEHLNFASRGNHFANNTTIEASNGCIGKKVYGRCSVGGSADGHRPTLQSDGKSYCSGSLLLYIDFSHCFIGYGAPTTPKLNSNTSVPNNNNTLYNSGGNPNPSSGNSTITTPVTLECDNCSNSLSLTSYLNLTDQKQINWVNDSNNTQNVTRLFNFGDENQWSNEIKIFAKSAVEVLSLKELLPTDNVNTFKNRILKITSHLKAWGNPEDRIFANYIESLIPDFNKMTVGDVYDIYKLTKKQGHLLIWKYVEAVVVPFAEAAYPFVVYAVTEATLGAAIPLISRIPITMVTPGIRLEKMIEKTMALGSPARHPHIKIFRTHLNPERIAKEIFNSLTKNRIGNIREVSPNVFQANMGNGNFIIYRTVSKSGFEATLEFNFPQFIINNRPSILKFTR